MPTGKVFLVGAGPGDPGLISVRGLRLVESADVVVFDQLGAPAFLDRLRPGAEKYDVGKRAGDHTLPQDEINALLVRLAREGKTVVRLKGGDPMVFGRGAEELEVLVEAGVPFEVVPGIPSAVAGPAYAGIPITHRDFTTAVTFVTGHEADQKETSTIPWSSLAGIGTVVFFMGVKQLPVIASRLIEVGRPATTPVALIEQATTPRQRTVTGTLADIAQVAAAAGIKPPALIVVGETVRLRERLAWFEKRPLFGRTIAVTRSRLQASGITQRLEELGARVLSCPTIAIERLNPNPAFDEFLTRLDRYGFLVFTSVNGVDGLVETLWERQLDLRILAGKQVVCIGPATAEAFTRRGIRPDFVPETYVAEALLPWFCERERLGVAILRAEQAREVLPEGLAAAGFPVEVVPLYRTLGDRPRDERLLDLLRRGEVDAVTFSSSSTVDRFMELLPGTGIDAGAIPAVAIGPVTAETCRQHGLRLLTTADRFTIPGLIDALVGLFPAPPTGRPSGSLP